MTSPMGLHRVVEPAGVLPQAAQRLDTSPEIGADEVRVAVERLNLDAASFRQLATARAATATAVRAEVLAIIETRGKMHNPVTGSGGMLIGTVDAVGPDSPLGLRVGDRVATLVSLTLTPLRITDELATGTVQSSRCRAGYAILFGRSIAAKLPDDLDPRAGPGGARRVRRAGADRPGRARLRRRRGWRCSAAPARAAASPSPRPASRRHTTLGVVPNEVERDRLAEAGLADAVAVADARDPVAVSAAVVDALGGPADVTVVCVDVPGCEHGAILATAAGGTVVFFSMATSFAAAALGAEGLAADVTMLIGNGYVPGHAGFALDLLRSEPGIGKLFRARLAAD